MKRYALAGASSRALQMFARPIVERFAAHAALVGIYDPNRTRARFISRQCGGTSVFDDFIEMLKEARPDCVIVTTVDRYHHEYIIRSLEAGCDVISEKPLTIDEVKCRAILAAEQQTGRRVTVTFNYRFQPYATRIKELLREGVIGTVLSVDFQWLLDTNHGADYFRRWHRRMENSGGLFVHKATHHFDLVNWWLEDEPEQVFAVAARRFYGPTRPQRGIRCSTCEYQQTCEFYVDYISDPLLKALYFDAEHEDGYYRDGCVFADEIDIYDTMNATVKYKQGAQLSYSLVAYSPYEGWHAAFNGTAGRLELHEFHSGPDARLPSQQIKLFNHKGEVVTYDIPKVQGGHGGGDERLQERLFAGQNWPDPLGHMADSWAGAMSILIGVAANRSASSGLPVRVHDLLQEAE